MLFQRAPVADLRTPRCTFDTFCRSILTEQPDTLWQAIHPDLRDSMQARLQREGSRFFTRMKSIVTSAQGRLSLGDPSQILSHSVACPVMRGAQQVGTAWFSFLNRSWLLTSLT